MFQRATTICLLFLTLIAFFLVVALVRVRSSDLVMMKKTLKEQEIASSKSLLETADQKRKGVVKEIWFTQEDHSRLHYRIASESSVLTIQPEGKKFDLIEKLENIQCWMQDKIYTAPLMQQIRFFQAQEGLYRYTTQEFLAQSVALSLFRINGNELPRELGKASPFLKGIAQDVSFAISGKNPQFNAQNFKAELGTQEEKK